MKSKLVFTVLLVVMLVASMATPLAVAQRPEDVEPVVEGPTEAALSAPEGAGIESLSGSYVTFDPSVGGDVCYAPGMAQTFCFRAESFTNDYEYVYNLWQKFPADWTVTNVYVEGTPYCDNGSWGSFNWSFQTSPYEVNIAHSRYQSSVDHCTAYYCFDVVSGTGDPDALESWYWSGDGWGSTPHHPCSDDNYTPAGQPACDEMINPQALVPPCELDPIMLTPVEIDAEGCPCEEQEHELTVWNNTDYATTVELTYAIVQGGGSCSGPAQVYVGSGATEAITVNLYPQGEAGDVVTCEIYAEDAANPDNNDTSWINKTLIEGGFDPAGWQLEPNTGATPMQWGAGVVGTNPAAAGDVGYYAGGLREGSSIIRPFLEMFDPDTGTWTQLANMPNPRFSPAAAWIDGLLYAAGGYDTAFSATNDLQVYDPVANTWDNTTYPDLPNARGGGAGGLGTCASGGGECLFHVGGGPDGSFANTTLETWQYDPAGMAWTQLDNKPAGSSPDGHILGAGVGCLGQIYVGGDYRGFHEFFRLDATQPSGSQWTQLANIPPAAGAMTPALVCKEDWGKIVLIGGDPDGGWGTYNTTVYVYDIATDTWEGPLPQTLNVGQLGSAGVHMYDKVWTFGGTVGSGAITPAPHESLLQITCEPCPFEFDASKEAPAEAAPGEVIEYKITIEAGGVYMEDWLPAGVQFVGNLSCTSGECWYDGDDNAVYWEYAVKGPGASAAPAPADTVYLGELILDAPLALAAEASGPVAPTMPSANPEAVLWDQYANWSNTDMASQDFEDAYNVYDIFAADDFENTEAWAIDTIVTRGGWGTYVNLNNATAINWWICPDNGGEPLCDPPGDGNEFWGISLPPSDPQVQLGVVVPEDVYLNLDTPIVLPPGTWWLVYQASLEFGLYGQYGWSSTSDSVWGSAGMQNNPGEGFGMGAGWWANSYGYDMMFRLEGDTAEPPTGAVITFDVEVTGDCGEIIVNEGSATDGDVWVDFEATTEVVCVGEPDIVVTPEALDEELCPDTTMMVELEICNEGDAPLEWALSEVSGTLGVNVVLYDNGPLVTHPGGGYNGEDASALQTALGLNTYGFGNQYLNGYRMADDFEITDPGGWDIDTVTFFAYQTGTYGYPPVSTITGLYFQIWDGPPNDPGSSVVFGDLVTNRLQSTGWPNIYRVLDTDLLNTQRPPMATVATAGVSLPAGTYWLDWMTDGSGASGPWAPPISILGETTTGNAMQYTGAWAAAVDTGLGTPQGMPFIIEGGGGVDVPWLSEDMTEGVVQPGMCQAVEVTFDSTGMEAGSYYASLLIESNDPDEPEVSVPVTMTVLAPVEIVGVDYDIDGLMVSFDSDVIGSEPIGYEWAFGDGGTSMDADPVHEYAEAGCYTVTLSVEGACGSDSWSAEICVEAACEPVDGVDFTWEPEVGTVGEPIMFYAEVLTGTAPLTYTWTFGDGAEGEGMEVSHTYEVAGIYTVTLWVENGCGEAMVAYLVTVESGVTEMEIYLPVLLKNF